MRHSEMLWPEGGRVMIASARPDDPHFTTPAGSANLYVVTDDPDAVHAHAEALGASFPADEGGGLRLARVQHPRPRGQLLELRHLRRMT
ncbi:glyoxalase/bleomycin resistance/extradiol dioxygenase family protein [Janibacter sp. YB324]|uniref:VOC family protein n=1 Tax=Janibacter sp. YB324 TaxID=2761047 RepID=UPI001CB8981B|nr:hypothetical protein [Janibacter sp. YB324]